MMGRALIVKEARPLGNAAGSRGSGSERPMRREHA
jgi:hypothetical protein